MAPALLVLLAAALWGTTGTAQALGPAGLDPRTVGSGRLVLGGALLATWVLTRRVLTRRALANRAGRDDLRRGLPWRPLLASAGCVAAYQLCFFAGVARDGVAVGTLVAIGSAPVFTGLVGWLAGQGRPGRVWAVATILAVAGCVLLVLGRAGPHAAGPHAAGLQAAGSPGHAADLPGVLLALGAGLAYAGYTVGGKRLIEASGSPTTAMAAIFAGAGVLLLPVLVVSLPGGVPAGHAGGGFAVIAYLAVIPTGLAYLLFGRGLAGLPPPVVATLSLAEPLVASVLGVAVLGEPVTAARLGGAALIFAGLVLSFRARGRSGLPSTSGGPGLPSRGWSTRPGADEPPVVTRCPG